MKITNIIRKFSKMNIYTNYEKYNIYYDRIDVFEGIDINKTRGLKKYDIFYYQYVLDKSCKFQPDVYNGCHDLLMTPMNLSDSSTLNIKSGDYRCIIGGINKSEAINLMRNTDLTVKSVKM